MAKDGTGQTTASLLIRAGNWFSGAVAAAATFICAGPFYSATVKQVGTFAAQQYGQTTAEVVTFVWGPFTALLLFSFFLALFIVAFRFAAFWLQEVIG